MNEGMNKQIPNTTRNMFLIQMILRCSKIKINMYKVLSHGMLFYIHLRIRMPDD